MTACSVSIPLMLVGVLCCHAGWAAENITFGGTLIEPPPCTISDGNIINVDFQNKVGINKVDGVNYLKTIDYSIVCNTPGANPWEMRLSVSGTSTPYDSAAVQTDINDLGIRLLQNGQPFTLNTPITVARGGSVVLQAVPVKKPGATLSEGPFVATATLKAEYQ